MTMSQSVRTDTATTIWDVVVIGGGPAGMMAAAVAGRLGKRVLLLEKNPSVGKKLLITGGGRCNVTNNKRDVRTMLAEYKDASKYLFSAFMQHSVADSIDWFTTRGVPLVEENEGRLFPKSNTAQSVWNALVAELRTTGVVIQFKSAVRSLVVQSDTTFVLTLQNGNQIYTQACVMATGGTSRPETGSTGDGFRILKELGHQVVTNNFALVPITVYETWSKVLSGVSLPDTKLSLYVDGKKYSTNRGKLLFTHVGLSGPLVLNQSRKIGELLDTGTVSIKLDLIPDLDAGALKSTLQALLVTASNKKIKNILTALIPAALVAPVLDLAQINADTPCHSVRTENRKLLVTTLKALPLTVSGLLGPDKAVVSAGGVDPREIDFKTMESRIVPKLFVVGDVLNVDRPSGGYSLQLCWTTGYVAGLSA